MKNISFGYFLRLYLWLSKECEWLWEKALQRRLAQGKETTASLLQKWGNNNQPRPVGHLIWGHAVGVGEAMALAGLLRRMSEQLPDVHFLITTTARTSGEALQVNGLPERCMHQFAPIDTPRAVNAFLDHWKPSIAIWCEMDLWPTLITSTYKKNIPSVLVNARLTQKSANKRRWAQYLYQDLFSCFQAIWVQNLETKSSLIQLGAIEQRIQITGTLKALSPPLCCNESILNDWKKSLQNRSIWLLASSHLEDERVAIEAHQQLLKKYPQALLIIAPRVRLRGEEILKNIGDKCQRRTQHTSPPEMDVSFYVADTIGEMGLWYRLAPIALMGGSFEPVGGHNPYEPLTLSCQVLHGPKVWNFSEAYQQLASQGWVKPVSNAIEIENCIEQAWLSPQRGSANAEFSHQHGILVETLITYIK